MVFTCVPTIAESNNNMDSSLILDGSFTVSLFYNCVAVYDESRRNFDYFANIKSAAAGNKVMLF
jgi:hypothetical protein